MAETPRKNPTEPEFVSGDKVIYRRKIYDFGYISKTGRAVIYQEGEENMQDAIAVNIGELRAQEGQLAGKLAG